MSTVSGGRRRWPDALKQRVVTETLEPGVQIIDVARRHGVPGSLASNWRTLARRGKLNGSLHEEGPSFADDAFMAFAPVVGGAPAASMMADVERVGPQIIVANVVVRLEAGASVERICAIVRGLSA